ncbi:MAG: hypothetical protein AAF182_03545 [Pseudomonadota bacterium]
MKNVLRLSLLLSFLAVPSIGHTAPSNSSLHFYPSGPWASGHTNHEVEGLPRQDCYLSAAFNNGFTLQITGSSDWVQAIEIDFKQDIFEMGSMHAVKLTVPGLNAQSIPAKAVSPSILSLDVSDTDNFYTDMRNSAVLDFGLDDNEFRFYMVGLSNQAPDFEKCMARSTVMKTSNRAPVPVVREVEEASAKPFEGEKRDRILERSTEATYVDDVMPTMTLKRRGRKRFSEVIADEIEKNPGIADGSQTLSEKAQRRPRSDEVQMRRQRFSEFTEDDWAAIDSGEINTSKTDYRERAKYRERANGAPKNLLMPPGFEDTP